METTMHATLQRLPDYQETEDIDARDLFNETRQRRTESVTVKNLPIKIEIFRVMMCPRSEPQGVKTWQDAWMDIKC